MWRTPATLDGSLDDVPNAGPGRRRRSRGVILAIETSCDDTCAAVVTARRRDPRRTSSPRRASTTATAASCPRSPPATTSSWSTPSSTTRWRAPARRSTTSTSSRSRRARASSARCSSASPPPRASPPRAACRWRAVDHLQGHVAANFLGPRRRSSRRSCASSPAAATRSSRASTSTTASTVLGRTLDDAAGEAFDKGARLLGLPFPGGPHLERLAARRRPARVRLPDRGAASPGLDFSFAGLKTALLYTVRDLGEEAAARAPRRPRRLLPARDRRGARAARRARRCEQTGLRRAWRSAAAWRPTARCASAWPGSASSCTCPPRELCTDNAAMIASAARYVDAAAVPGATSRSTPTRPGERGL